MMSCARSSIASSLAQRPGNVGHTWALLQYLLGFRRLGFDVLFLDRIEPDMCVDRAIEATRSFDFGLGAEPFKSRFAAGVDEVETCDLYAAGVAAQELP